MRLTVSEKENAHLRYQLDNVVPQELKDERVRN